MPPTEPRPETSGHQFADSSEDFVNRFKRYGAGNRRLELKHNLPSLRPRPYELKSPDLRELLDLQIAAMQEGYDSAVDQPVRGRISIASPNPNEFVGSANAGNKPFIPEPEAIVLSAARAGYLCLRLHHFARIILPDLSRGASVLQSKFKTVASHKGIGKRRWLVFCLHHKMKV